MKTVITKSVSHTIYRISIKEIVDNLLDYINKSKFTSSSFVAEDDHQLTNFVTLSLLGSAQVHSPYLDRDSYTTIYTGDVFFSDLLAEIVEYKCPATRDRLLSIILGTKITPENFSQIDVHEWTDTECEDVVLVSVAIDN